MTTRNTGTQLGKNLPEIFRSQRSGDISPDRSKMAPDSPDRDSESSHAASTQAAIRRDSSLSNLPTRQEMSGMVEDIKSTIKAAVEDLRADLGALAGRVSEVEDKEEASRGAIKTLDKIAWSHNRHLVEMSRHLEDLDNRGRRNNLRVRGIPESVEQEEIPTALTTIFNQLLQVPEETPIDLVRAHRALRPKAQEDQAPRDIVCCLADFKQKEEILSKARSLEEICYKGKRIELYQDLSPLTLQQRRALRPLLSVLRDHGIPYRWRFPFGLSATRQGRTQLLRYPEDLEEFCLQLKIPRVNLPDWLSDFWIPDVSAKLEDRRHPSPQRQERDRRRPREESSSPPARSAPTPPGRGLQNLQRFRRESPFR